MMDRDVLTQTLAVHWKNLRWTLAALAVLGFALPLLWAAPSVAMAGAVSEEMVRDLWIRGWSGNEWTELFPLLAAITGALVALGVWYPDHQGDHVYALSLPVPRPRYVLGKLAAGALLVALVAVAFYAGALVATLRLDLPELLHAHPGRLAVKFFLAMLVVYSVVFALAAGTVPTALKALTAVAVLVALAVVPLLVLDETLGPTALRFLTTVAEMVGGWPGPFAVLGGDWGLVGV